MLPIDTAENRQALANVSGNHGTMGLPVPRPSFSFLCDEKGGELQLGGYDPDAVIGFPTQVASLSQSSYMVPVTGSESFSHLEFWCLSATAAPS